MSAIDFFLDVGTTAAWHYLVAEGIRLFGSEIVMHNETVGGNVGGHLPIR